MMMFAHLRNLSSRIFGVVGMLVLASLLAMGAIGKVNAQQATFTAGKTLCSGNPDPSNPAACATPQTVQASQPVFYQITVVGTPNAPAQTITLSDVLQSGFIPAPPGTFHCTDASGNAVPITNSSSPIGQIQLPIWQSASSPPTVICTIPGTFSNVNPHQWTNTVAVSSNQSSYTTSPLVNTAVNPNLPPLADLSVTKSASPTYVGMNTQYTLPATVTYTINIHNNGPSDVDIGPWFTLHDSMALMPSSVPLTATLLTTPGSFSCTVTPTAAPTPPNDCLDPAGPVPATPSGNSPPLIPTSAGVHLFDWSFPNGSLGRLAAGGTITLTYQVTIDKPQSINCVRAPNSDGVNNTASFSLSSPVYVRCRARCTELCRT